MTETGSQNRVRMDNGVGYVEFALDYTDGYRVTVGWSDEDDAWIARITGVSTGDVLAHGDTKEEALLALACSAAATIDAINQNGVPMTRPSGDTQKCARCGHSEDDHDGYGGLCDGLGFTSDRTMCGCSSFSAGVQSGDRKE